MESNLELIKIKKQNKKILIIIGIIVLVFLFVGIISVSLFIKEIGKGIDGIKDKIDAYEEKEQTRKDIYDSIPK